MIVEDPDNWNCWYCPFVTTWSIKYALSLDNPQGLDFWLTVFTRIHQKTYLASFCLLHEIDFITCTPLDSIFNSPVNHICALSKVRKIVTPQITNVNALIKKILHIFKKYLHQQIPMKSGAIQHTLDSCWSMWIQPLSPKFWSFDHTPDYWLKALQALLK